MLNQILQGVQNVSESSTSVTLYISLDCEFDLYSTRTASRELNLLPGSLGQNGNAIRSHDPTRTRQPQREGRRGTRHLKKKKKKENVIKIE